MNAAFSSSDRARSTSLWNLGLMGGSSDTGTNRASTFSPSAGNGSPEIQSKTKAVSRYMDSSPLP